MFSNVDEISIVFEIIGVTSMSEDKIWQLELEEYIRQGEKADHASWTDRNIGGNNPRIVQNIKNGIIRKIRTKYTERVLDSSEKKNVGLSHALANILLPSADFGKAASTPDHNGGDSDTPKKQKNKKKPVALQRVFCCINENHALDAWFKKAYGGE